jgi:integrase
MAKKPSVRYWDSREAYGCWIDGTQHILAKGPNDGPKGPTYKAAVARFQKLIAMEADKGTDEYLVSSLLNQYRVHLHATRKSGVPGVFDIMARDFGKKFGSKKVRELKPHDFDGWLASQTQWNPTSQAHAATLILGALGWAKRKGFIQNDPLTGRIERPQPILRGRDARMSEELMDLLIGECFAKATYHRKKRTNTPAVHHRKTGFSEKFGKFLWLLRLTGARPIEIRMAEAHNYQNGRIVYRWNATRGYVHKTAKKTQRDRVLFLTPEAQAYAEECIKKYPEGPIFRTSRGDPWGLTNCTQKWRQWLLKRPKVVAYLKEHDIDPRQIRIYNFRHSWACNYLDRTGDVFGAAMMLGTSVKMLQTRYFHMDEEKLHARYLEFMAGRQKTE